VAALVLAKGAAGAGVAAAAVELAQRLTPRGGGKFPGRTNALSYMRRSLAPWLWLLFSRCGGLASRTSEKTEAEA